MKKAVAVLLLFLSIFLCVSTASAGDVTVFGPQKFVRSKDKPAAEIHSFTAYEDEARIIVRNGDEDGKNRVSSATVSVNAVEVFKTKDFNQQVDVLEAPVSLFTNNSISVELNSAPEGFLTIQVFQEPAITVTITSPNENAVINKPYIMVEGLVENPVGGEIGVVVNGYPAQVSGGEFFVNGVGLVEGENLLSAVATDPGGVTVSDSVNVNFDPSAVTDLIKLTVNPESGTSPLGTTFTIEKSLSSPLSSSNLICSGPGIPSITQNSLTEYSARFIEEGLYICTAAIIDSQLNTFNDIIGINVLFREEMDTLLQAKWQGMKNALLTGDINKAVSYFAESSRVSFQQQFSLLQNVLPQVVNSMGEITLIDLNGDRAIYDMRTVRAGKIYSFQLLFIKDTDGIWRIRTF